MTAESNPLRLRYPATCAACGTQLPPGTTAFWDRAAKSATCLACRPDATADPPELDRGTPGASARREWTRRRDARAERVRSRHPRLGGLILALTDEPQSTTAWSRGACGEKVAGRNLEPLRGEGFAVLHDRRLPGTKSNIDHLVVSPAGVFTVDAKRYAGRVEQRDLGGWFRPGHRLFVGRHDRTKLVAGAERQAAAVRAALAGARWSMVPVTPVLWFVGSDNWPLIGPRPFRFGQVHVVWGKRLGELMRRERVIDQCAIDDLERFLAEAFPPA